MPDFASPHIAVGVIHALVTLAGCERALGG